MDRKIDAFVEYNHSGEPSLALCTARAQAWARWHLRLLTAAGLIEGIADVVAYMSGEGLHVVGPKSAKR